MLHHRATWETQCILQSLINSCSVLFRKENNGEREVKERKLFLFQGSFPSQTPGTRIMETNNTLLQVGFARKFQHFLFQPSLCWEQTQG